MFLSVIEIPFHAVTFFIIEMFFAVRRLNLYCACLIRGECYRQVHINGLLFIRTVVYQMFIG